MSTDGRFWVVARGPSASLVMMKVETVSHHSEITHDKRVTRCLSVLTAKTGLDEWFDLFSPVENSFPFPVRRELLLGAQCLHYVDAGSASCGQKRCDNRDGHQ
jgi:hypothetical protein